MKDSVYTGDDSPERLFAEACSLHEDGKLKDAELRYRQLLEHFPGVWQLHFNLGLLLFEAGRLDEALAVYSQGLAINPAGEDLLYNTAICQKALGQFQAAVDSYRLALELSPDDIDCLYNLAGCYRAMGEEASAIDIYENIIDRTADHLPSLNNLAYLVHKKGDARQARRLYERILEIEPGHISADFMRAALSGEPRTQSPDSYVKEVFDEFADHYEESLTSKLGYDLPSTLYQIYRPHLPRRAGTRLLDLGCGTGLVGTEFHHLFDSMTGVDISAKMLEHARQKHLYATLHADDILNYLKNIREAPYDLVLSADVLPYIGVLEKLFIGVSAVLGGDGHFLFSVEDHAGDALHPVLQPSGRFAHSNAYVEAEAVNTGWRIIGRTRLDLRREREIWIKGSIYLMSLAAIS